MSLLLRHAASLSSSLISDLKTLRLKVFPSSAFDHRFADLFWGVSCFCFSLYLKGAAAALRSNLKVGGLRILNHPGCCDFCHLSLWGATAHRLGLQGRTQPCKDDQLITKRLDYYSPFIILLFLSFSVCCTLLLPFFQQGIFCMIYTLKPSITQHPVIQKSHCILLRMLLCWTTVSRLYLLI